jgi:hypothetical protein
MQKPPNRRHALMMGQRRLFFYFHIYFYTGIILKIGTKLQQVGNIDKTGQVRFNVRTRNFLMNTNCYRPSLNRSRLTLGICRVYIVFSWAAIAQSVYRLATGWTVRESNPGGGEIFRSRPDRPWGLPSLLYNGYRVYFLGVKRPGRGVDHPPHLAPRLKKE